MGRSWSGDHARGLHCPCQHPLHHHEVRVVVVVDDVRPVPHGSVAHKKRKVLLDELIGSGSHKHQLDVHEVVVPHRRQVLVHFCVAWTGDLDEVLPVIVDVLVVILPVVLQHCVRELLEPQHNFARWRKRHCEAGKLRNKHKKKNPIPGEAV